MSSVLVECAMMECPLCDKLHLSEKRKRSAIALIKGEKVEYDQVYYICKSCEDGENEFIPGGIFDSNLLAARNAYRKKHGLLTSEQIVELRNKFGLTQKDLARLLGWGEATIARYETKLIQDETHDDILRTIQENAMEVMRYLEKNKESFTPERYATIHARVNSEIGSSSHSYLAKKKIEVQYIPFQSNNDYTGNVRLNLDKVCNMAAYFAEFCQNLYKVKLMKLLWYTDALHFQQYGCAMSGLVYQHMPMGALPVGHYDLMELIPFEEIIDECNGASSYKILPKEKFDANCFSHEEKKILSMVLNKFSRYTGSDLAKYMHEEVAYRQTKANEYIPYSLSKQIRAF